jgi:hypothetical protein
MATVLNRQQSLTSAFTTRAAGGVLCLAIGMLIILVVTRFALLGGLCIIAGSALLRSGYKFHLGAVGERRVAQILNHFPDDWYIFHDLVVGRAQIDHILICPRGVYTLETKNYRGTIYGNADKQNWSQVINQRKRSFYNPVKQAVGHSVALRSFLRENGFPRVWVNTIVVFTHPQVQLKVASATVPVLYLAELRDYLQRQEQVMSPHYSAEIATCVSTVIPASGNRR